MAVNLPMVVSGEMDTFSNFSKISLACLREETLLASTSSMPWICETVSADALARTGAMSDTMRSFRRSVGVSGLRANVIATFPPLVNKHETTSTPGDNERTWNVRGGKYLIKIVCDKNQEHPQPCGHKSWVERAAKSRGCGGPARLHVTPRYCGETGDCAQEYIQGGRGCARMPWRVTANSAWSHYETALSIN